MCIRDSRNYARLGYGFCAFACEMGATQFEKVRQAIAYSFDQDAFIMEHLGSFAIAVYSYYGVGQWMTLAAMGALLPGGAEGEEALLWDEINLDELNHYDPDPEAALALLIEDGWTLNENGEQMCIRDSFLHRRRLRHQVHRQRQRRDQQRNA